MVRASLVRASLVLVPGLVVLGINLFSRPPALWAGLWPTSSLPSGSALASLSRPSGSTARVVAIVAAQHPSWTRLMAFLEQWQACRAGQAAMDVMPVFASAGEAARFQRGWRARGPVGSTVWTPIIARELVAGASVESWQKTLGLAGVLDLHSRGGYEFALLLDTDIALNECAGFGGLLAYLRRKHQGRQWHGETEGTDGADSVQHVKEAVALVAANQQEEATLRKATQDFHRHARWCDLPYVHLGTAADMFAAWGGRLGMDGASPTAVAAKLGSGLGPPSLAGTTSEHLLYQLFTVLHHGFAFADLTAGAEHASFSNCEDFWRLPVEAKDRLLAAVAPPWLQWPAAASRVGNALVSKLGSDKQSSEPMPILLWFRVPQASVEDPTLVGERPQNILELAQEAVKSAHASWCAEERPIQTGYSLAWHDVLPFVVKAFARHLQPGTPEFVTMTLGDIYGFGVAQGHSMAILHSKWPRSRIYGFDGFAGLPAEDHKNSTVGQWQAGSLKPQATPKGLIEGAGGAAIAKVIVGFFDVSLTTAVVKAEDMGPAFYVDVDCDLHSSTYTVLDWLFSNRLARVGTIIGYDDWWTISCTKFHQQKNPASPLSVGEGLAHAEIAKKYGVRFDCVAGPCLPSPSYGACHLNNNWGPIFMVTAIGGSVLHGFNFTAQEEQRWMNDVPVCHAVAK